MPKCSRTWYKSYNIELGGPYHMKPVDPEEQMPDL